MPETEEQQYFNAVRQGILSARPGAQTGEQIEPGQHALQTEDDREALVYIPRGLNAEQPAPLALMLHGAGGSAQHGIALLQHYADEFGIVLLAPKSLHVTWDAIADEYGVDAAFIDGLLEFVFERFNIDAERVAVGGFSDGASYALALGLINGELFTHVIAFSPGFAAPTRHRGTPRIYVSHGTGDRVLPVERCSRRIVPQLQRGGYDVTYQEFDGAHTIPPDIARAAVVWFNLK